MTKLENKRIIVSTHVYADGPAQALRDYLLKNRAGQLLFIGHPLFFDARLKGSGYELYEAGEDKKAFHYRIKRLPAIISYLKGVFLDIIWPLRFGRKWDLCVACDNLNAFSGIILHWLGAVDKTVYYVIDYTPRRFKNRLINKIYHFADRFCVRHATQTWNLSGRMIEARKKYFDFSGPKQKVVPIGVWLDRIKPLDFSQIEKHTLVFMGHILKEQGIQYVFEAIPEISREIPDFKFLIIGGGKHLDTLKEQAERLNIGQQVKFTGYVSRHEDIEVLLAKCAVAIVMYQKYTDDGELSWPHFTDSGKIKSYLACGLPVILNDVPPNAGELIKRDCGIVVACNRTEIAQAVISLMKDEQKLRQYRQNAINYSKEFDWNLIFKNNLERILEN